MTVVYDATKGRSVVAPATGAPPLLFKVRGSIGDGFGVPEDQSADYDLKVMNSAGALQPAASLHQYMRVVFTDLVEAYKRKDRELRQEAEADSDSDNEDDVWYRVRGYSSLPEGVNPMDRGYFDTWHNFKDGEISPILSRHRVPWPVQAMFEGLDVWVLDKLLKEVARRRRDAVMLRLVVLNTPKLAGVAHLFDDFIPIGVGVIPTVKSLKRCLQGLERGYQDNGGSEPGPDFVDAFHTTLRADGTAQGALQYYTSAVRWSCAPPDGPHVESSDDESGADY